MKKTILPILMVFVMMSSAFAVVGQGGAGDGPVKATGMESTAEQTKQMVQSHVQGLETAMMNVKNESQRQHLERVMNRITERKREQLANLSNLTFEKDEGNRTVAKGKARARFLDVIPVQKEVRYEVTNEGELMDRRNMVERLLFTYQQNVKT